MKTKILPAVLIICLCLPFTARVFNALGQKSILDRITFSQAFYDRDGNLLRLIISPDEKYRLFAPLAQMPRHLTEAVLTYEDRHFYRHFGVNPAALARAAWATFITKNRRMGASTITMQLARKIYDIDSAAFAGKIRQIMYALWLEIRYTKAQILEAYLNIAPYGYNIEGAGAASLIYFGGRVQDMNLLESMTLAVVPQNPKDRIPSRARGFANMQAARALLYKEWLKKHPADERFKSFFDMPMNIKDPSRLPFEAPHVITYLQERETAPEVFTAIDLNLQKSFEEQLKLYIARNKAKGILNASALLLNYRTMEVEAAVGSADFWDDGIYGQVNGFAAKRLIASTLKPFIYALALDKGLIHPATLMKDTPRRFGIYSPENADRSFAGPLLAREALAASRNIPAIELLMQIGPADYINFLKKAGVSGLRSADYYGISLAIGTFEVSSIEAAQLYALLAGGEGYKALTFTRNSGGAAGGGEQERLISPEAGFITLDMLKSSSGVSRRIRGALGRDIPAYVKTGTSSSFKDAWAAGVFGDYVLIVWVGNFSGEGNNYFWGRTAAQPLFYELVEQTAKNRPNAYFGPLEPEGLNIVETEVCKGTGDLPGPYCPALEKTWFIPRVSPIKISDIHRRIYIDKATGLRACKYDAAATRAEIFEFWPSEIEALFKAAGIIHRPVPRYLEGCDIEEAYAAGGAPPRIVLPAQGVSYPFRERDMDKQIIPLRADTDKDARTVYWFLDNKFAGAAQSGQTLFIRPAPGNFALKAVDDLGRAVSGALSMTLEAD
ncbi:MAG: penicillin-binding protein 1C [Elusimicrobiota bacterium]|jgi:penicillin-binding protein 1C|nr:penicillin-binding protein 1C [Elusimicrobiota bacterium]